ncbi:MAG: urease accessory protein UreD [Waterburya sp.]
MLSVKNNLELQLQCNLINQTFCHHQYTSYPLRLSPIFRFEGANYQRAYLYLLNTSPGLLAGDTLNLSLQLAPNSHLYLTDQAATKVHPMPEVNTKATMNYQIVLEANSSLELVPEPIILYKNSILEQHATIKLHPKARLFLSEIILPGRLAKQEFYDFNYYFNRLQVKDLTDKLLFSDAMRLIGKDNPFKNNKLFSSLPIMGNAIAILPDTDLNLFIAQLNSIKSNSYQEIEFATTILPSNNGILIRALAAKTLRLKMFLTEVLNCIRSITSQSPLPHIPK